MFRLDSCNLVDKVGLMELNNQSSNTASTYLSVQTSIVMAMPEQLAVSPCRFRSRFRLLKSTRVDGVLVAVGE